MDINLQVKIKITIILSRGFKQCLQNFNGIFSPNFRLSLLLRSHQRRNPREYLEHTLQYIISQCILTQLEM